MKVYPQTFTVIYNKFSEKMWLTCKKLWRGIELDANELFKFFF